MRLEKLENIASIQIGKTPKRAETKYWGKGHPWVSISDLKEHIIISTKEKITDLAVKECGCKMIPKDTLLMSFKLSIGKLAFAGTDLFTNEAICGLQIKNPKQVDPNYLYYALKNTKLIGSNVAVKGATLNTASLKALRVPLAEDISTQLHIANILSKAENLIAQRKESIALLDEFLKSTFLEMFGDPVINNKKWEKTELKNFGKIITGNTPSRKQPENYSPAHIEWIKTDNIEENKTIITQASECLSEKGLQKARQVKKGALLVACIAGSIESVGRAAITDRTVSFNQQINAIQPSKNFAPLYLYWLFKIGKKYIQNHATKGMKKILTKGEFEKIQMIKPPLHLQAQFAQIVEKTEALKIKYQQSLQELEKLYGSLSQRAFRGELKIAQPVKQKHANISNKALLAFYQKQIIGHVIKKHREHRMEQGEMILAKDLYHLEALYGIKTHFQFKNWHYGTYDNKIRQLINGKDKFFMKKSVGQKGFQVLALGEKSEALFDSKYVKPELEQIDKAMDDLLKLYASFPFTQRSHKIELLNTVCKSMVDAQSTDLTKVREVMKQWKTTKAGFKNKAEKFSEQETDEMIELIINKEWDKKLL